MLRFPPDGLFGDDAEPCLYLEAYSAILIDD
jgi:hypothetical protein